MGVFDRFVKSHLPGKKVETCFTLKSGTIFLFENSHFLSRSSHHHQSPVSTSSFRDFSLSFRLFSPTQILLPWLLERRNTQPPLLRVMQPQDSLTSMFSMEVLLEITATPFGAWEIRVRTSCLRGCEEHRKQQMNCGTFGMKGVSIEFEPQARDLILGTGVSLRRNMPAD